MKKEITDRIVDLKLQKLLRSNRYQDSVDAGMDEIVAQAKAILRGVKGGTMTQEETLRSLYHKMLEDYSSKKKFIIPKVRSDRSRATWGRIEQARIKSGQDAETYLLAQFGFFHEAFGKTPTLFQLGTPKAVIRAQEFVGTKSKVVGVPEYRMEVCDLLRSSDQRMRALCKAQDMTRKEVYERLVKTNLVIFPKEYTRIDPVYKEVMGE